MTETETVARTAPWRFIQLTLFPDEAPSAPPEGVATTAEVLALRGAARGKRPRQLQFAFAEGRPCPKTTTPG